jgi:hypothetical protein
MNKAALIKYGLIAAGALAGIIIHQNLPTKFKAVVG